MKNTPRALIALIKTAANVMLQPPEGGGCRQGSGSLFALVGFFSITWQRWWQMPHSPGPRVQRDLWTVTGTERLRCDRVTANPPAGPAVCWFNCGFFTAPTASAGRTLTSQASYHQRVFVSLSTLNLHAAFMASVHWKHKYLIELCKLDKLNVLISFKLSALIIF